MTSLHVPVVNVKYAQKHKHYKITLPTYVLLLLGLYQNLALPVFLPDFGICARFIKTHLVRYLLSVDLLIGLLAELN